MPSNPADYLDTETLFRELSALIAIRSDAGNESAAQSYMADLMTKSGLVVDCWDIDFDALSQHPAYTVEIHRNQGLGLVGTLKGRGEAPPLVLNGHIDVVPPGEMSHWTCDPFVATEKQDRIYGRGACDMKAGLLAGLFAMKAWKDSGEVPPGDIQLWSVIGEEDGGAGTLATIERGHTGAAAVIMEPTSLKLIAAQAGALNFRIRIDGKAAHGAMRLQGEDAIEHFYPVLDALRDLESRRNRRHQHPLFDHAELPFALSIGTIRAGSWPSTVADSLVAEGRLGFAPGEQSPVVKQEFEDCVASAAASNSWLAANPPAVEWWGAQFESAQVAVEEPIVTALSNAFQSAGGGALPILGAPYGADMRLMVREASIPTVLFGPGDIRVAHSADEYVEKAEVIKAAKTLVSLMGNWTAG